MNGTQNSQRRIADRIRRFSPGHAFIAKDFLDIAARGSIDVALSAMLRSGKIRRIRRGLYDVPKFNPGLGGALSPDFDEAARALARRHRWTIVPEGAWAANLLGLSTQVPARIAYLSNGPNRRITLGRRTLLFKHARPHALGAQRGLPALVVQALRYTGEERVNRRLIRRLQSQLSEADKRRLVRATRFGVDWIYQAARKIAGMPQ